MPVERFSRRRPEAVTAIVESSLAWQVKLFILSLALPWEFAIGPAKVSPNRLVLLVMLPICVIAWLAGKAGRFRLSDFGILLFAFWCAAALLINQRSSNAIQSAGILIVETAGAYMLARRYVRNAESFHMCMMFAAKVVACILPFALIEWATGKNVLMMLAESVLHTLPYGENPKRMGFWRAQGPFLHPIIFGLFAGSTIAFMANTFLRSPRAGNAILLLACCWTTVTSMSSAPLAALLLQIALIGWNYVFRSNAYRWKILWGMVLLSYLIVEFGSNQTPVQFYISKFTFEQQTGWYRIWIWEHGSASVLNNLWIGIGLNDWVRPKWMVSDSVDNFWLLTAMRYGLPALLLLAVSALSIWLAIARRMSSDFEAESFRTSYLICMVAFVLVGATVHFWGAVYVWFFFLLGAGVALIEAQDKLGEDVKSAAKISSARRAQIRPPADPRRERNMRRANRDIRPG